MRSLRYLAGSVLFCALSTQATATVPAKFVKVIADERGIYEMVHEESFQTEEPLALQEITYPQMILEHQNRGGNQVIELRSTDLSAIQTWLKDHNARPIRKSSDDALKATDELRTIVQSGPSSNRIDLVFMGDGYTEAEREKFFSDIARLTNDMFVGQTFASYLPLFNVHAVFRPSNKSGIGKGSAIDTAYGLYREGETLRGIIPTRKDAIRGSCAVAPGCDYPVVIANDPYYGGLGGEFAISTSSPTSGTVVLRHELGHNFGRVGEEYDGGGVYSGANYSYSATNLSWSQWASESTSIKEPMFARFLAWPWHKLSKGTYTADLESDGKQTKTWLRISASGIETPDTLSIKLNGQDLPFQSPNRMDRSFINIELPGLAAGKHKLQFSEQVNDNNNWLSSLSVHEYHADFHDDPAYVGAFPVFSENRSVKGYRPTNESCLMRDMEHPFFCPVCQENNWLQFFGKIKLIDTATLTKNGDTVTGSVSTQKLGQFRPQGQGSFGEYVNISWFADGRELTELQNKDTWTFPASSLGKSIEVRVSYSSPEIRKSEVTDRKTMVIP